MTSQQISCFLAVARCLNFTKAAEDMYISQPAVSRQIRALEKELDVVLFERYSSKTKLTPGGEVMYRFFSETQSEYFTALNHARKLLPQPERKLTLGVLSDWTISTGFRPLQEKLKENNINCSIELYEFRTLISMLQDRKLDAILTMDFSCSQYPDLMVKYVCEPKEVILFSKHHPLASKTDLQPIDFINEVFLVPPHLSDKEMKTTDAVKEIISTFGFVPKLQTVSNRATMLEYVRSGLGVCLNITWVKECTSTELAHIVIDHTHPVSLVWRKSDDDTTLNILATEIAQCL